MGIIKNIGKTISYSGSALSDGVALLEQASFSLSEKTYRMSLLSSVKLVRSKMTHIEANYELTNNEELALTEYVALLPDIEEAYSALISGIKQDEVERYSIEKNLVIGEANQKIKDYRLELDLRKSREKYSLFVNSYENYKISNHSTPLAAKSSLVAVKLYLKNAIASSRIDHVADKRDLLVQLDSITKQINQLEMDRYTVLEYQYPSGSLKQTHRMYDKKYNGVQEYWYETGQKECEKQFKSGRWDGSSIYWYENGSIFLDVRLSKDKTIIQQYYLRSGDKLACFVGQKNVDNSNSVKIYVSNSDHYVGKVKSSIRDIGSVNLAFRFTFFILRKPVMWKYAFQLMRRDKVALQYISEASIAVDKMSDIDVTSSNL